MQAREARVRACTPFVLPEFAEHFGGQAPTVWVRIATLTETHDALVQAYAHIAKKAAIAPPIERDAAFVEATKAAHILAEVYRDRDGKESLRAFPDVDWICDHLTPYEVRVLLDRYNSVVQASQPGAGKVEPEWVADLAMKCADLEGTGVPDIALQECSRDMLAEMFVRLSMMWRTEREENEALRAAVAEYETRIAETDDSMREVGADARTLRALFPGREGTALIDLIRELQAGGILGKNADSIAASTSP